MSDETMKQFLKDNACPYCDGRGIVVEHGSWPGVQVPQVQCAKCNGTGVIPQSERTESREGE